MAHFKAVVVVALAALVLILGGRFADLSGTKATAANGAKPIALQRPLDGGPVLFYPTGPDGMYTPGLFQDRYLADGTRAAAIVDHDAGAFGTTTFWLDNTNATPGENVINATFFKWEMTPTAGHEADASMSLAIDLCHYSGDSVTALPISKVNVDWASPRTMPTTWMVEGSLDNHTYFPLVPRQPTDRAHRESYAGTTSATFAPANVRYVRITGRGATPGGKLVMTNEGGLTEFYASAAGPPISNKLIFDAGKAHYETVNAAPPGHSAANWAATSRITGYLRDGNLAGSSSAKGDAQLVIDYQVVQAMAHFAMIFYGTNTWQWGGKVEVSADNATWTTLVNQTTPLGTLQIGHDVDNRPIDAAHPLAVRYVRITDYCRAANGAGTGRLCAFQSFACASGPLPRPVYTAKIPGAAGTLSAGIYDMAGKEIKFLVQAAPYSAGQTVDFYWDGRDQYGAAVPTNQQYEIRLLTSQAKGFNDATVGNTGEPPYDGASAPCDADSVAVDPADNLYVLSSGEENSFTLRRMNASGAQAWGVQVGQCSMLGGRGLATDGAAVYVDAARENGAIHGLYKYDAASGRPLNFSGRRENFADYAASSVGGLAYALDSGPIAGLAADPGRIWCLLGNGTMEVHRKDTGAILAARIPALVRPQGIAVQDAPSGPGLNPASPGVLWISTGGSNGCVKKYTWTIDAGGAPTVTATSTTTDVLNNPYGLAYGGPQRRLYVAEVGSGAVKSYDPARPSSPARSFGHLQTPGPVAVNSFLWKGIWANPGIAVNGRGEVIVTDHGNQRVQWLDPSGTRLMHSYGSDYAMFVSVGGITSATHQVFSRGRLYEVNNADGSWIYAANYYPDDLRDWGGTVDGGGVIRTLNIPGVGKRDFVVYYYLEDQVGLPQASTALYGVSIYALEPAGMRKCVLIANFNSGGKPLADGHAYSGGLQIWTDKNGNGALDPGEWASSDDSHSAGNSDVWMDADGNLWFGRVTDDRGRLGAVIELPLAGWSQVGSTGKWNPVYRWNDPKHGHKLVVPAAVPEGAFAPHYLQIGAGGTIYQIGNTPTHTGYCNGHGGVRISNSSGAVLNTFLMPDRSETPEGSLNGFSPDPAGGTGFFFTDTIDFVDNTGQRVDVWTEDGLKIARALPGAAAGYSAGWPDQNMSLAAFTLPADAAGTRHVYVEDDAHSKAVRYTFTGLDTVVRSNKRFTWPPPVR